MLYITKTYIVEENENLFAKMQNCISLTKTRDGRRRIYKKKHTHKSLIYKIAAASVDGSF